MKRPWLRIRVGAAMALVSSATVAAVLSPITPAFADASAPPAFPAACNSIKGMQKATPSGALNPPADYSTAGKPIPYEVPFKGIIFDGNISLPPYVTIPHIYASLCGLVELPQLSGTIVASDIDVATPNIYVGPYPKGIEALPTTVAFGQPGASSTTPALQTVGGLTQAPNGGLNLTLQGDTTTSVTTLGMTCSLTLNATFTTQTSGVDTGTPVTGPSESGQAEVVSNSFAVPAVPSSSTCPPSIAQTFNKLLDLPARTGLGSFVAPFCFDFELEGINTPSRALNPNCPWP